MAIEPDPLIITSPAAQIAVGQPIKWVVQRGISTAENSLSCEILKDGSTVLATLSQQVIDSSYAQEIDIYTFRAEMVLDHVPIPEMRADGTYFYEEEFFQNPQATALISARFFHTSNATDDRTGADITSEQINIYRAYPRKYETFFLTHGLAMSTLPGGDRITRRDGREFISILAGQTALNAYVDVHVTFTDDTYTDFSHNYGSIAARGIAVIEVSEAKIRQYFSSPKRIKNYTVELENKIYTYIIEDEGEQLFWLNRMGGIDTFTFNMSRVLETGAEQSVFRKFPDLEKQIYGVIPFEKTTLHARFLSKDWFDGMRDLVNSRKIWLLKNGLMMPVTATSPSTTEDTDSNLYTFSITVEL